MDSGPKSKRLLMYGYDSQLLETRRSILKLAGLKVCDAAGPRMFGETLKALTEPYDLWVICHTVPSDERASIAALAAQRATPVFQIDGFISPDKLTLEVLLRLAQEPVAAA